MNATSSSRLRPITALAATAALALSVAGCGANRTPANTATGASTTSTAAPAPGSTAPSGSNPTTPSTTSGSGSGSSSSDEAKPYPSAITDSVVANPKFAPLERVITERITAAGLPGASLLVLQDGNLVEQNAFGTYDLTTKVPIASASKWLTGATLMTIVEDGLIDLDKPISTYLPDAKGKPGTITTRQLMAFTSGLEYDERIPCYSDLTVTLAQCNAEILALPLLGDPGTGYRYTGTHLHVAAGVAEAVTGQTWEQIFQERIAVPLGMTNTTMLGIRASSVPGGHPTPAGSAQSTLGDYGRFMEMLVHDGVAPDGTRILEAATIVEMGTDQTEGSKFVSAAAHHKAAETPYGLAHWLDVVDENGVGLVESSPGAFGFRPWIDHVNNIAGVYLIQDMDDSHVADSPNNTGNADIQTSGNFVLVETAKALGGKAPTTKR